MIHPNPLFARVLLAATVVLFASCSKQEAPTATAEPSTAQAAPAAPPIALDPEISAELAARLVRDHAPVLGPPQAPVTLVEFLDPACEGCAAFSPIVKQIQLLYPDELRVVVRFAAFHQGSDEAVRLLVAAQKQGKFDSTLDALFERQQEWASHHAPNVEQAWKIAADAGLNIAKARRDASSASADEVLRIDGEDVVALKVDRTPTFFVNARALSQFGPDPLLNLVKQEVEKARAAARP